MVHGASRAFNPTLPQSIIDDALKRDPAAARAEWLAEWRDDIAAFLSRELVEAAVDTGVVVRPPSLAFRMTPSSIRVAGLGDSFAAAIAHKDDEGRVRSRLPA